MKMSQPLPDGWLDTGFTATISLAANAQVLGMTYADIEDSENTNEPTDPYYIGNCHKALIQGSDPLAGDAPESWALSSLAAQILPDCEGTPDFVADIQRVFLEGPFEASPVLLESHTIT
jgi:hypothetical protein